MLNTVSRRLSSSGKRFGSSWQNSLHLCSINHLFPKVRPLSLPQGLSGRLGKLLKNQCQSRCQLYPYRRTSKSGKIWTVKSHHQLFPVLESIEETERILTLPFASKPAARCTRTGERRRAGRPGPCNVAAKAAASCACWRQRAKGSECCKPPAKAIRTWKDSYLLEKTGRTLYRACSTYQPGHRRKFLVSCAKSSCSFFCYPGIPRCISCIYTYLCFCSIQLFNISWNLHRHYLRHIGERYHKNVPYGNSTNSDNHWWQLYWTSQDWYFQWDHRSSSS